MLHISESTVESAALAWLADLGYAIRPGPEVADEAGGAPLLAERLRAAGEVGVGGDEGGRDGGVGGA